MILILFSVNKKLTDKNYTVAKVWVNCANNEIAEESAIRKLIDDGCVVNNVIEITPTQKDDYFAPCSSLGAFILAETEGISVLYA